MIARRILGPVLAVLGASVLVVGCGGTSGSFVSGDGGADGSTTPVPTPTPTTPSPPPPGSGFDSGLPEDALVNELSPEQLRAWCPKVHEYGFAHISEADRKRLGCYRGAHIAKKLFPFSKTTCDERVASCLSPEDAGADDGGTGEPSDDCSSIDDIDTCRVTVKELELCVTGTVRLLGEQAVRVTCDTLDAEFERTAPECDAIQDRCPGAP